MEKDGYLGAHCAAALYFLWKGYREAFPDKQAPRKACSSSRVTWKDLEVRLFIPMKSIG